MAQLIVRNLEESVVRKLRESALKDGVSVEEEHRRVLRQALLGTKGPRASFKEFLFSIPPASVREPPGLFRRQRAKPGIRGIIK